MSWFLLAAGVFALACTYAKPNFYWESRKARGMRNLIGDKGTEIFYYVIGVLVLGMGFLSLLNIISLK